MIMKRLGFALLIIGLSKGLLAQGFSLTQPDAVGGNLVGMTQDLTSYEATPQMKLEDRMAIGPGIEFFLKYDVSPKLFLTIGTGVNTINHPYLNVTSSRTTLLPTLELKMAYQLMPGESFSPFLMAGVHAFGHTSTTKTAGQTITSDRYYDGSVFVGGGGEIEIDENLSFQVSGDIRFVVSSDADPQPQYWVAKAGLTYNLQGQTQRTPSGEEIEYPLGDDELASLDDLFKDTGTSGSGGDDFADLDLLFAPEESGSDTEYSDLGDSFGSSDVAYAGGEASQLQNRIQQLKMEMDEGFRQIQELEAKVQHNEQMLAGLSGNVAGAYAGVGSGERLSDHEFRQRYDAILARVNAKQFRDAIPAFMELMTSNPDHKLASNCQYWIGECYNAIGDYAKAIAAFNRVMEYRSSYKFDDALIMTGVVSMKMGDNENAKQKFQELVNRYPDSEYAPKAMRYLGRL
jgi:tol-pal system protein YbgF